MANDFQYTSVFQKASFGDYGFRILTTGEQSVSTERFGTIQAIADSVVAFDNDVTGGDANASLTLNAGMAIYGNIKDINVTSGKVIAYLR